MILLFFKWCTLKPINWWSFFIYIFFMFGCHLVFMNLFDINFLLLIWSNSINFIETESNIWIEPYSFTTWNNCLLLIFYLIFLIWRLIYDIKVFISIVNLVFSILIVLKLIHQVHSFTLITILLNLILLSLLNITLILSIHLRIIF